MSLLRYLPRFAAAERELPILAERESWSRDQIESFQLASINAIWSHAIQFVPYYQRLRQERGLAEQFLDLAHFRESVPVLKKAQVREEPLQFQSTSAARGFWRRTGGSTGAPMRVYWSHSSHFEMLRTKYRALQMRDCNYWDRTTYIWGHSGFFQPGWKGLLARLRLPFEDGLRNRQRLSAYHVGREHLTKYLIRMRRFQPRILYGYSTAIRLLAEQARLENCVPDSLRLIIVTGEPADQPTIELIESIFDAPVMVEYGSVECGHIAHSWPDRTLRAREDVMLVETLPQDSDPFQIVVTPLNNPSFPLLRYEIEDLTSAPLSVPARGFAILQDVMGRNNDFLVASNDEIVHSSRLDAMFKYQCRGVRRFRVHQHPDGSIEVEVEFHAHEPDTSHDVESALTQLTGFPVTVRARPAIELSPAGKHRLLVSELAQQRIQAGAR